MFKLVKLVTSSGVVAVNPDHVVALEARGDDQTVVRTTASTEGGAAKRYTAQGSLNEVMDALNT